MPKVSVIIPVYNVSETIERCAINLFEQSLDDIEYIFIDDCSKDNSVELLTDVLSRYPNRESQSIIIKLAKNSGVANVRRIGMEIAKGEYIIHCDSDDWPDKYLYERMYEKAVREDADVVISEYVIHVYGTTSYGGQCIPGEDLIKGLLNNRLSSGLWNKLVKNSIVHESGFIYPSENMCEDYLITTQYLLNCKNVSFVHDTFYHYYYNTSSIAHVMDRNKVYERHLQIVKNISASIKLIQATCGYTKYDKDIIRQHLFVKNALKPVVEEKEGYRLWKETFKESNWKIPFCAQIPLLERGVYLLILLHMYGWYQQLKNRFK